VREERRFQPRKDHRREARHRDDDRAEQVCQGGLIQLPVVGGRFPSNCRRWMSGSIVALSHRTSFGHFVSSTVRTSDKLMGRG
jgi:hypothetical protein